MGAFGAVSVPLGAPLVKDKSFEGWSLGDDGNDEKGEGKQKRRMEFWSSILCLDVTLSGGL